MPSWGQVLQEINAAQTAKTPSPLDSIRRKYLAQFAKKRGRNAIAYYSGWLQKPGGYQTSINDDDKNGLMATIHGLDRTKGLDLLLHTPGGDMAATESLIDYLHKMFDGNIEAFVPQLAMSAGTMIACTCRKIFMGKQSNIGPIDPQYRGVPAHGVIKEFEDALQCVKKDPASIALWRVIIGQYNPTLLGECRNAIQLANEIVQQRLETVMFAGDNEAKNKATLIVDFLNEHEETKIHARHIDIEQAIACGLKIIRLEDDKELQDLVLTVHHCFMHAFARTNSLKIIENDKGIALIYVMPQPQNSGRSQV